MPVGTQNLEIGSVASFTSMSARGPDCAPRACAPPAAARGPRQGGGELFDLGFELLFPRGSPPAGTGGQPGPTFEERLGPGAHRLLGRLGAPGRLGDGHR